jgi:hypothetical protein
VNNDRLVDALMTQAFTALLNSPGARAYYHRMQRKVESSDRNTSCLSGFPVQACVAISPRRSD